ncbi:hypothetical protein J2799_003686 [Chryseobacterium vietnamense]|uniref:hypothetical protein n=1 Tax=Chryseobacterium vietnamense TaxID=866785 RepID=UPI0028616A2D|nr:hypothetical protein [Chryseobacterium vietnamense]MDR6489147.1 hypothetical protein [Chryseobacterium vietnamense]
MRKLGIFCLSFVICSCTTKKNIYGNYQYKGVSNGFPKEYNLSIRKDSFDISYKSQDAKPNCVGSWEIFQDTLYLRCNKENIVTNILSNGYMNKRNYKLKIIGDQKFKIIEENIILIKK